jgi:hypothetical protein
LSFKQEASPIGSVKTLEVRRAHRVLLDDGFHLPLKRSLGGDFSGVDNAIKERIEIRFAIAVAGNPFRDRASVCALRKLVLGEVEAVDIRRVHTD